MASHESPQQISLQFELNGGKYRAFKFLKLIKKVETPPTTTKKKKEKSSSKSPTAADVYS